jgi:hypothetical protein
MCINKKKARLQKYAHATNNLVWLKKSVEECT